MKTLEEIEAVRNQKQARFAHCISRCHAEAGAEGIAKVRQQQSAHLYRMARCYMGFTNGDVKKANQ